MSDADVAKQLLEDIGGAENAINNQWMAGRWGPPPGTCSALTPAGDPDSGKPGFHDVYEKNGELSAKLGERLGDPMPNPCLEFGRVASQDAPGITPAQAFDPRMLT